LKKGIAVTRQQFLSKLESAIEADEGSIQGTEKFVELERWDSLAVMAFIAMVDEEFGVSFPATKIAAATGVGDLLELVEDKLAG
jgi:acyl carrier protein